MMRLISVTFLMASMATQAALAQSKVVITPVAQATTTITGQKIQLDMDAPQVTVSMYEIPPAMALPKHRHPYQRYGYVLSGQLRVSNAETGESRDFSAGDFIVESVNQWHSGMNPGDQPLKLLVIDQAPSGKPNIQAGK